MSDPTQVASMFKRLAAIFYDALLLFSLVFAVTLFVVLPVNHGEAIDSGNLIYQTLILLLMYGYFGWQWTHGGQTLGMRAWRIKLVNGDKSDVNWTQASLRFLIAILSTSCLFLGFVWALFNRNKQAWHDRYSHTMLINC